jgi:predicted permease
MDYFYFLFNYTFIRIYKIKRGKEMSSYLVVLVFIILLMLREKQIRPTRMWITPILLFWLACTSILSSNQLTPISFILYFICLIIGIGIGVWRGKLEKIRVNHESGIVTSQSSVTGVIVFLGILLLRILAANWGKEHAVISLTNALMFIPLGSVFARRYIIYMRYKQLTG